MERNNLDLAMLITDAILNEFEKNGKLDVPLDEHKYSFDLQDVIQEELDKLSDKKLSDWNAVCNILSLLEHLRHAVNSWRRCPNSGCRAWNASNIFFIYGIDFFSFV